MEGTRMTTNTDPRPTREPVRSLEEELSRIEATYPTWDERHPSGSLHDDAIDMAKVRGHSVVYDGPTMGGADRWTCIRCGRAILKAWGPFYGSAKDEECDR